MEEWGETREDMGHNNTKHVADENINGKRISTVFIGLENMIFETMVFDHRGYSHDIYCDRYATWDEAVEGHKKAVQWVLDGCE